MAKLDYWIDIKRDRVIRIKVYIVTVFKWLRITVQDNSSLSEQTKTHYLYKSYAWQIPQL